MIVESIVVFGLGCVVGEIVFRIIHRYYEIKRGFYCAFHKIVEKDNMVVKNENKN